MRGIQLVLMVVAMFLAPATARPASLGWQEAITRIAAERQRAEVCARQLRKYGDDAAVTIGAQLYEQARADLDAVIEALVEALAEDQVAANFAEIEARLKLGVEKRETLCAHASRWLPDTEGERDFLTDVGSNFRGLMIDAAAAIYGNRSDEEPLTRRTIATQLQATSLDDFETVTRGVEPVQAPLATTDAPDDFSLVEVFFGTDRKNEGTPGEPRFAGARGGAVSLGKVVVTVPKRHRFAQVERPGSFLSFSQNEDPAKHFTIQQIQLQDQADFTTGLREIIGAAERFEEQAVVFVHGFNVGFDAAAYRTAQIVYDLGFDGAPMFYSWPSRGGIKEYEYDQNSARQARRHLRSFLEMVRSQSGAKIVHLIAHSMGTDPLMEVLAGLLATVSESEPPLFNQVILAAPDIDRDVFLELAKQVRGVAEGITLYASSKDVALQTSRIYARGVPRAGDVPATGPVVDIAVDTIDASELGTDFFSLKHSEYADHPILLNDIGLLMLTGRRPPNGRLLALKERTVGTGRYWVYPPH